MGNINPTYKDRVRFILSHPLYGTLTIDEPIGWDEDEKEFARNDKYHGIFTKFSNSLKFILSGATFINNVRGTYGVNAEIRLVKDERHPVTDIWTRQYEGFLDLSEWEEENGEVSVKFNSSGLETELKAREGEKIEVERETNMDGGSVDPLVTKNVIIDGRNIFLESTFDVPTSNDSTFVSVESNAGNTRHQTSGLPLQIVNNSHQGLANTVTPNITGTETQGDLGMTFFFDMDRQRTINLKINGNLNAVFTQYENVQWCFFRVDLVTYENGLDFNVKNRTTLSFLDSGLPNGDPNKLPANVDFAYPQFTKPMSFAYQNDITLLQGESLGLEVYLKSDMYVDNNAGVRTRADDCVIDLVIKEDSEFAPTTAKMILAHEFASRMIEIISGRKKAFYSEALGRTDIGYAQDGIASLNGFTHGMWVRGFDKLPLNDDNKYKAFTSTFKDFTEAMDVTWDLGVGIERVGFSERVRMEDSTFFYNRNVLVRLGKMVDGRFEYSQVKKLKRSTAKEYYYSGINTGYSKGGEYEEAMGLDEYNGQASFTTIIKRVKNVLTKVSKFRTDLYGLEFSRRKQISSHPTDDTDSDKDIFQLDLKKFGSSYKLRTWEDDFEEEPTGVFSPETAGNLRLSPVNITLRRGWFIAASVIAYPLNYILYGSSTANSGLKTRLIGGDEYSENGDSQQRIIRNDKLSKPRFVPEWVEFEHEVDFELNEQLNGHTVINGRKIPNIYGLIEYKNDKGKIERGFLFNLKPNKNGKWKLLKSFR